MEVEAQQAHARSKGSVHFDCAVYLGEPEDGEVVARTDLSQRSLKALIRTVTLLNDGDTDLAQLHLTENERGEAAGAQVRDRCPLAHRKRRQGGAAISQVERRAPRDQLG